MASLEASEADAQREYEAAQEAVRRALAKAVSGAEQTLTAFYGMERAIHLSKARLATEKQEEEKHKSTAEELKMLQKQVDDMCGKHMGMLDERREKERVELLLEEERRASHEKQRTIEALRADNEELKLQARNEVKAAEGRMEAEHKKAMQEVERQRATERAEAEDKIMSISCARSGMPTVSEGMLKQQLSASKAKESEAQAALADALSQLKAARKEIDRLSLGGAANMTPAPPRDRCDLSPPTQIGLTQQQQHFRESPITRMPQSLPREASSGRIHNSNIQDPALDAAMKRMQNSSRLPKRSDVESSDSEVSDTDPASTKNVNLKRSAALKTAPKQTAAKKSKPDKSGGGGGKAGAGGAKVGAGAVSLQFQSSGGKASKRPDPFAYL